MSTPHRTRRHGQSLGRSLTIARDMVPPKLESVEANQIYSLVRTLGATIDSCFSDLAKENVGHAIIQEMKNNIKSYNNHTLDWPEFRADLWNCFTKLKKVVKDAFAEHSPTETMESARTYLVRARHVIHRYQRHSKASYLAPISEKMDAMMQLFEDGSLRRLSKSAAELIASMEDHDNEVILNAKESLTNSYNVITAIRTFVTKQKTVETAVASAETELKTLLRRKKHTTTLESDASKAILTISSLQSNEREEAEIETQGVDTSDLIGFDVSETVDFEIGMFDPDELVKIERETTLRSTNLMLKAEIAKTRNSIELLTTELSTNARRHEEEKLQIHDRHVETRRMSQSTLFNKLRNELMTNEDAFSKSVFEKHQTDMEMMAVYEQVTTRDKEAIHRMHILDEEAANLEKLIRLQRDFGICRIATNLDTELTATKREIGVISGGKFCGLKNTISEFRSKIDKSIEQLNTAIKVETMRKERTEADLKKMEDQCRKELDHRVQQARQMANAFGGEVAARKVLKGAVVTARDKCAKMRIELERINMYHEEVSAEKAKKEQVLSKVKTKSKGKRKIPFLVTELDKWKKKSEAKYASLNKDLESFQTGIGERTSLDAERHTLRQLENLLVFTIEQSEKWDDLAYKHFCVSRFTDDCVETLVNRELEMGRVPIDGESLSCKLRKLNEEITKLLKIAHEDKLVARVDSMKMELRTLQAQNKELSESIASMLLMYK